MRRALGTATVLFACASPAVALRYGLSQHDGRPDQTPGAHLQNLAGESFDVNQPGDHVLLRVPPTSGSTLIRVSGSFEAARGAPCAMHTSMVTFTGDWLGSQVVRVSLVNQSLHIKVSSSSPAYVGPWRSIWAYAAEKHGHEATPDTFRIVKEFNNTGFAFYVGHRPLLKRPVIKVKRGLHSGLDVFASNIQGFELPKVGGLLGSYKHNRTVERLSHECGGAVPKGARKAGKAASVTVDHVDASEAMQGTHLRNLLHEKFTIRQPGEYHLLRVPKDSEVPALIKVKGSFEEGPETPCAVFLQGVTLMGKWFGNKTVHLSSINGTLTMKVSSTEPGFAGKVRSIREYFERNEGPEVFPSTAKITALLDGPSFKFQLGPKKPSERANILVTQTKSSGLDIGISHMERTEQAEISGLLGMDTQDKSVVTPSEECKGKLPEVKANARQQPPLSAGSVLSASWMK